MYSCSQFASELLALPLLTFIESFGFFKIVISLCVLALVYVLVSRRASYTQTWQRNLLWWGSIMLLSWVMLICFAIEIKWVWRFFFG